MLIESNLEKIASRFLLAKSELVAFVVLKNYSSLGAMLASCSIFRQTRYLRNHLRVR